MRKSFQYIKWKNILYAPLLLLLILSTATTGVSAAPSPAYISVNPPSVTALAIGQNITIAVNITDINNCAGYDFWLYYNSTIVQHVEIMVDGPNQMAPPPDLRVVTDVSVAGIVKYSVAWKVAAPTFNGSGIAAWITFNSTMIGNSTLEFDDRWTKAVDYWGDDIPLNPKYGGEIEVIPEFPGAIAKPLLLIAILVATFIAKIVWSNKRRSQPPHKIGVLQSSLETPAHEIEYRRQDHSQSTLFKSGHRLLLLPIPFFIRKFDFVGRGGEMGSIASSAIFLRQ